MKLTKEDRKYLKSIGFLQRDLDQIEVATSLTEYTYKGKMICDERACELLGRKEYLSGISRSAFHFTAVRETPDKEEVFFDSSALFR